MDTLKKPAIGVIAAIVIFLLISIVYMLPALEGKNLRQGDIVQYKGQSKELTDYREKTGNEALWTNSMFGGMPGYMISTRYNSNLVRFFHSLFILNNWRPICFVFLYLLGAFIALLAFGVNRWLSILGAVAYGFSSFFFIIIEAGHNSQVLALGYMPPVIAGVYLAYKGRYLLGAGLMGLFLALQIYVVHLQITYYTLIVVLVYALFELVEAIKDKKLKHYVTASGTLFLFALLALGSNFSSLWTSYEYGKFSNRGKSDLTGEAHIQSSGLDKDYATSWSYGIDESFTLLIPNFKGGGSASALSENSETFKFLKQVQSVSEAKQTIKQMPTYFGAQPGTSGPVYAGAIIVFLFVLGLFIIKGKIRSWMIVCTVLSLIMAWGKNLSFTGGVGLILLSIIVWSGYWSYSSKEKMMKIVYGGISGIMAILFLTYKSFTPSIYLDHSFTHFLLDVLPGYNKFRTVSMTLVIAEFTIPVFAMLTLNEIIKNQIDSKLLTRQIFYALGITGGFCLIIMLSASGFNYRAPIDERYLSQGADEFVRSLQADRQSILRSDTLRSLFFIITGAVLLLYYILKKKSAALIVLGLVVLIDMWTINKRYLNEDNFVSKRDYENPIVRSKADEFILMDKQPDYRVLNLAADVFNDATTSYFHKSIGGYHGAKMRRYQELIEREISPEIQLLISSLKKGNMANADSAFQQTVAINMLNTKYIIYNPEAPPMVNSYCLGNAWLVNEIKWVNNADEEIQMLQNFDPATTAIIDKTFEKIFSRSSFEKDSTATIELVSYEANKLIYKTNCITDQLAVFSEIYYPKGWEVTIDKQPSEYARSNFILRTMVVPAGEHTIEFSFKPKSFYTGNKVSLASSLILILLLLGTLTFEVKKYMQSQTKSN